MAPGAARVDRMGCGDAGGGGRRRARSVTSGDVALAPRQTHRARVSAGTEIERGDVIRTGGDAAGWISFI